MMVRFHPSQPIEKDMDSRQIWQSQNFLRRPEFVASLVERTNIARSDLVIEIGPGRGIITQQLASRAGRVMAVEIDKRLATNLRTSFQSSPNVEIVEADFLRWQLPRESYKVFSNIPFNMTADIIRKLTEDKNPPELTYLIMQDKAAFRFMGKPKDSQTSILLKPWFDVRILANIDRREFTPVPKINAVLTEFRKREQPLVELQFRQWFRDFVVYGYNQWQPTILDAFREVFSPKQRSILAREIMIEGAKPSDLTSEQWLKLFETFTVYVPDDKKKIIKGAEERLEKQQRGLRKWHRTR
ncbi:23S ribosomal RNA methyltransferase Erm [Candidatus Shapirobacteria bacterium CG_4_9_14_0_2_um_filter_39_11]|uniref:23S ribosomal RNA methyltransferase Erm n=1 Tax=Candidatus Shapirobacteria bacterium CG_4_9_14_0_2_um_filter_39_11 TaxID=1974478 RepID=A0A2M8ESS3_9BACT|nr:MAG: 23S ribosomal RNA methyltransferase Erm [Candidatus Shapirobacteria bacterium CG_4_9_14_0_2_um_filter_39_11]